MPLDDAPDGAEPQAVPQDDAAVQQPTYEPPYEPQDALENAYQVITREQGWDPRLTRFQMDDLKRKRDELDRERRAFEQERQRQYTPPEDNGDPYIRRISNLERLIIEEREDRRKEREQQQLVANLGNELNSAYTGIARQSGLTKEQIEQRAEEFYDALNDLYPDPNMVRQVGADRAARAAFRLINQNGHRQPAYRPQVNGRGPTATRTIPGSPQPYMPGGPPLPPEENLSAEQLDGETDDQYRARLMRIIEGANMKRLPDGFKTASR